MTPSPEILVQTNLPLLIAASLDTFCLVVPQEVINRLSNEPSTKVLHRP